MKLKKIPKLLKAKINFQLDKLSFILSIENIIKVNYIIKF